MLQQSRAELASCNHAGSNAFIADCSCRPLPANGIIMHPCCIVGAGPSCRPQPARPGAGACLRGTGDHPAGAAPRRPLARRLPRDAAFGLQVWRTMSPAGSFMLSCLVLWTDTLSSSACLLIGGLGTMWMGASSSAWGLHPQADDALPEKPQTCLSTAWSPTWLPACLPACRPARPPISLPLCMA